VHVETGVDDVQEDGFARNDIDGGRTERILARDEIDLSRIRGRPGRRARGGPVRLRVAAGGRYDERCEQQRDGDTSAAVGVRYGQGWASRPSLAVPPAGPWLDTVGGTDAECAPPTRTAAARRRAARLVAVAAFGHGRARQTERHGVVAQDPSDLRGFA